MTIEQDIYAFLRDAQYRIAEISIALDELNSVNDQEYIRLFDIRHQLVHGVDTFYNARFSFVDNKYRFLNWTDEEVRHEIEYLRYWGGVNEIPYITFTAYYPWIVNNVVGSGGVGIGAPNGTLGQYIVYGLNNSLEAQDFPTRCGMIPGENINDYFAGRL